MSLCLNPLHIYHPFHNHVIALVFLFTLFAGPGLFAQIDQQPVNAEVCEGDTAAFSVSVVGSNPQFHWQENRSGSWDDLEDGASSIGSLSARLRVSNVPYSYNLYGYRCRIDFDGDNIWDDTSNVATLSVTPILGSTGTISGLDTVCANETGLHYNIPPVPGAEGYRWTVPDGVIIVSECNSNSIVVNWMGAGTGVISVQPYNSCFNGNFSYKPVSLATTVGDAQSIFGDTMVCATASGIEYFTPSITGASNYSWTVPPGAGIIEGQHTPRIVVDWKNSTSGTVSIKPSNRCFEGGSFSRTITLLPVVVAAQISRNQEICYEHEAGQLETIQTASGGTGSFTYQWECSPDTTNFTDIQGADNLQYLPGTLTSSTYFRLNCISDFGCPPAISNLVFVKVFDPFLPGSLSEEKKLCYNEDPGEITFLKSPSGGNSDYAYSWQQSDLGVTWSNMNKHLDSYSPGPLIDDIHYRIIATSGMNCGTDTTNSIHIHVFEPFQPGAISGDETVCEGVETETVIQVTLPSGGDGTYTYKWQWSSNDVSWTFVPNEAWTDLSPGPLYETTFFRRMDISGHDCGEMTTNSILKTVNSLPDKVIFSGPDVVCRNEADLIYSFQGIQHSINHSWSIEGGILHSHPQATTIKVDWDSGSEDSYLMLTRRNEITGCIRESIYNINKKSRAAPEKSDIVKKQGSDMLISLDNLQDLNYRWGFTNLSDMSETLILENEKRYCTLPHTFDSVSYRYWIKTSFIEDLESECITISFMGESLITDTKYNIQTPALRMYPNPASGILHLGPMNINTDEAYLEITDLSGHSFYSTLIADPNEGIILDTKESIQRPGIYIVTYKTKNGSVSEKLVIY